MFRAIQREQAASSGALPGPSPSGTPKLIAGGRLPGAPEIRASRARRRGAAGHAHTAHPARESRDGSMRAAAVIAPCIGNGRLCEV